MIQNLPIHPYFADTSWEVGEEVGESLLAEVFCRNAGDK